MDSRVKIKIGQIIDINITDIINLNTELNLKSNKSGDETISDVKTFSSSPIIPTPTTNMQAATKKYVDDSVSNAGGGDMLKSIYDINNTGIVDNSELVNGLSVLSSVPSGALFTDTVFTPSTLLSDYSFVDNSINWNTVTTKDNKPIEVTVTTARTTAAKIGTTVGGSYVPQYGDKINVTFTLGCSVSTPTINIDGDGAKNIRLGGVNITTTLLSTGSTSVIIPMWYNGSAFELFGSYVNTQPPAALSVLTTAEAATGTSSTARAISALNLKQIIDAGGYSTQVLTPGTNVTFDGGAINVNTGSIPTLQQVSTEGSVTNTTITAVKFIDGGTTSASGSVLDLSDNITGISYNRVPSSSSSFSVSNLKSGGFVTNYINTTGKTDFPTITNPFGNVVPSKSDAFRANATFKMMVETDGTNIEVFFIDYLNPSPSDISRYLKKIIQTSKSAAGYTLVDTDVNSVIPCTNTTTAITVNTDSITRIGDTIEIDYNGTGTCQIVAGTATLISNVNNTLFTDGQYSRIAIQKISSTGYRVFGQLARI